MITAKQVWTEVFRLDRGNRQVSVTVGENGLPALVIANPADHFYVEVSLEREDALKLAAELTAKAQAGARAAGRKKENKR
jgi:hypothetical protein